MPANLYEKRIAILGATSHIAKGLIYSFSRSGEHAIYLFARSPERVQHFLASIDCNPSQLMQILPFREFYGYEYDAVINCVGIGSPVRLQNEMLSIFNVTEEFDNLVLTYLKQHRKTLYINLSSGAAYGTDFSAPVDKTSQARFNINTIDVSEYYGIAKINSEAKHRALKDFNIVDLRVFGYFSRFIDLKERFLLSEIVTCLQNGQEFVTGTGNIIRDFVHPQDLSGLIRKCMVQQGINEVYDVYSAKPTTKLEIIEHFAQHHGLKYRMEGSYATLSVTGFKDHYYSTNNKALSIGYVPVFSSIDGIQSEVNHILK